MEVNKHREFYKATALSSASISFSGDQPVNQSYCILKGPNMFTTTLTQTAIVCNGPGKLVISSKVPLPMIESDMVLIKTAAVALNPADAKMVDYSWTEGAIAGYDFSGTVVALGIGVTEGHLQIGDRVAGFVHGMNSLRPHIGAFAEYVGATADILFKIPAMLSFEEAAAMGTGVGTAGMALYFSLGLTATPETPAITSNYVLVYGGSTATGIMAIQILKRAGIQVVTTCSPEKFELVMSYGAEKAFDYHSPDCAQQIKTYTKNTLRYAFDCVTEGDTMAVCLAAIRRIGGKYTAIEPYPERYNTRKTVKVDWVMVLALHGHKIALDGAYGKDPDLEARDFGKRWFSDVERYLQNDLLRPHPLKIGTGGFAGVLDGVEQVRKKQVSGFKLVYNVASCHA